MLKHSLSVELLVFIVSQHFAKNPKQIVQIE